MKKLTLTLSAAMICVATTIFAQSKIEPKPAPTKPQYQKVMALPPSVTIKLSKSQAESISGALSKIDSAIDSKTVTRQVFQSFMPLIDQTRAQLVQDSILVTK